MIISRNGLGVRLSVSDFDKLYTFLLENVRTDVLARKVDDATCKLQPIW